MAINSVDMNRALESASYAQQLCRSGQLSASQKGQLVAKWGNENVAKWTSVDGTEYQIDDVSYDSAKKAGKAATADSVGYDGDKSHTALVDAGASAVTTAASIGMQFVGSKLTGQMSCKLIKNIVGKNTGNITNKLNKCVGAWVAATLAAAEATLYLTRKPNKDQHEAAMKVQSQELPQGQASLIEAQNNMADATNEVTALSEEAETVNTEANEKMEEDKALFDFYKEQYDALKAKAESGEQLTPDEKALMKQLAPLMEELGEGITVTQEDTTETVQGLYDQIEGYQDAYDEAGETIAEVEGMTDYAEGFDESTRIMCYVEAGAQTLNAGSAALAFGQLVATNVFGINTPFIALAAYASGVSGTGAAKQLDMASQLTDEIHERREVQDLGLETTDMYGEELDNFAGNMEVVNDLELEVPEDIEVPEEGVPDSGSNGMDPLAAAAAGASNGNTQGGVPFSPLTGVNNSGSAGNSNAAGLNAAPNLNAGTPADNTNSPTGAGSNDDIKKKDQKI